LTSNTVGIVCALAAEARHLGPVRSAARPILSLADGTLLTVSGMGAAAATSGARALVDAGARALASWGMAGGLDPSLAAGTVVLPMEIVSSEGAVFNTSGSWRQDLASAVAPRVTVISGRLLSMPGAVASVAAKAALLRETGAVAVDMESASVAAVAAAFRLPFLAVRVIVDAATDTLPSCVAAAADQQGHLRLLKLIAALARAPGELGPLFTLARRYRVANRSLAALARTGSLVPCAFSAAVQGTRCAARQS